MAMTPAEIRHVPLHRALFGYRRADIDDLLDEVVDSFTACWQERVDLRDRIVEFGTEGFVLTGFLEDGLAAVFQFHQHQSPIDAGLGKIGVVG